MATTDTLAFEIGTEEIPAFDLKNATSQLETLVPQALDAAGIPHGAVAVYTTPRRLIAIVEDVATATAILMQTPKAASEPVLKLLKSAAANAENNHQMDPEKLYVSSCYANPGPIIKRIMPRAQGRAYRINKRTSHVTVAVSER